MNCPHCQAQVADGSETCLACGVIFAKWAEFAGGRRPPAAGGADVSRKRCPKCGAPAEPGAEECPKCGIFFKKWRPKAEPEPAALRAAQAAPSSPANQSASGGLWLVLLAAGAAWFGYGFYMERQGWAGLPAEGPAAPASGPGVRDMSCKDFEKAWEGAPAGEQANRIVYAYRIDDGPSRKFKNTMERLQTNANGAYEVAGVNLAGCSREFVKKLNAYLRDEPARSGEPGLPFIFYLRAGGVQNGRWTSETVELEEGDEEFYGNILDTWNGL